MTGNHMTARAFAAKEIRRVREAKGLTRDGLAKALFVSESLVAAWETGRRVPKPEYLGRLIAELDLSDLLARLIEELVNNEAAPEWMGKWLRIERDADSLLWYEPLILPGLLQIEGYAREVIATTGRGTGGACPGQA